MILNAIVAILTIYIVGGLITAYVILKEKDSFFTRKQQIKIAVVLSVIWPYLVWENWRTK